MEERATYKEDMTWATKRLYIDVLVERKELEKALQVSREHSQTMKRKVGFGSLFTFAAIERYLEVLEKTGRKEERIKEMGKYLEILERELMEGDAKVREVEERYHCAG